LNNKYIITLFLSSILTSSVFGANGEELCKQLKINPSEKASKQWERFISNPEKLKSIGASDLSSEELDSLKEYLIEHAADSDTSTVPGK
jgi:hypothetical protein